VTIPDHEVAGNFVDDIDASLGGRAVAVPEVKLGRRANHCPPENL